MRHQVKNTYSFIGVLFAIVSGDYDRFFIGRIPHNFNGGYVSGNYYTAPLKFEFPKYTTITIQVSEFWL